MLHTTVESAAETAKCGAIGCNRIKTGVATKMVGILHVRPLPARRSNFFTCSYPGEHDRSASLDGTRETVALFELKLLIFLPPSRPVESYDTGKFRATLAATTMTGHANLLLLAFAASAGLVSSWLVRLKCPHNCRDLLLD